MKRADFELRISKVRTTASKCYAFIVSSNLKISPMRINLKYKESFIPNKIENEQGWKCLVDEIENTLEMYMGLVKTELKCMSITYKCIFSDKFIGNGIIGFSNSSETVRELIIPMSEKECILFTDCLLPVY